MASTAPSSEKAPHRLDGLDVLGGCGGEIAPHAPEPSSETSRELSHCHSRVPCVHRPDVSQVHLLLLKSNQCPAASLACSRRWLAPLRARFGTASEDAHAACRRPLGGTLGEVSLAYLGIQRRLLVLAELVAEMSSATAMAQASDVHEASAFLEQRMRLLTQLVACFKALAKGRFECHRGGLDLTALVFGFPRRHGFGGLTHEHGQPGHAPNYIFEALRVDSKIPFRRILFLALLEGFEQVALLPYGREGQGGTRRRSITCAGGGAALEDRGGRCCGDSRRSRKGIWILPCSMGESRSFSDSVSQCQGGIEYVWCARGSRSAAIWTGRSSCKRRRSPGVTRKRRPARRRGHGCHNSRNMRLAPALRRPSQRCFGSQAPLCCRRRELPFCPSTVQTKIPEP